MTYILILLKQCKYFLNLLSIMCKARNIKVFFFLIFLPTKSFKKVMISHLQFHNFKRNMIFVDVLPFIITFFFFSLALMATCGHFHIQQDKSYTLQ